MNPLLEQLNQRLIRVRVEPDDEQANNITALLLFHESEHASKPVQLHLEVEGGSGIAALTIYDTIRTLKAPVHTRAIKPVGGATLLLLAAGARGHRVLTRGTRVQWTELSPHEQPEVARRVRAAFVDTLASLIGRRADEISRLMAESRTMTVDAALDCGLVDLISD